LNSNRQQNYRFRTGDQALVRQINLSVIMHQLRENAPISRANLAELTGLNKTTVSSLVYELIQNGFVREVGLESSEEGRGAGRRAVMLTLDPDAGFIISAEIGVDFISVITTNFAPDIIWKHKEKIDPDMGQRLIVDRALALLLKAVAEGQKKSENFLGLAVGVPGLVDMETGTLLFAPNLRWKYIPLRSFLENSFDTLIIVDNEANMAALGEIYFGSAQGYQEVLYVSAGVGLGGGIVHNGKVCRGATGFAGEIGHMTVDPQGELCNCGNRGCWESFVSQRTLFKQIEEAIGRGERSSLAKVLADDISQISVPLVAEAAREGDQVALQALENIGGKLGVGIASLVNALNPELVVFGGILSLAGDILLPVIKDELERRSLKWSQSSSQIVLARHGFDACVMGGVAMVYQSLLASPDMIGKQAYWKPTEQPVESISLVGEYNRLKGGGKELR
jgi:glucokinase-like ROK family protein